MSDNGVVHAVKRYRGSDSFVRLCDRAWVLDPVTEVEHPDVDCMACIAAMKT